MKAWTFICCDPQREPVAKFSVNIWALKRFGSIEFCGPKAGDRAATEEIVVTGITLYTLMALRMTNVLSLWGAVFRKPSSSLETVSRDAAGSTVDTDQSDLGAEGKKKAL